MGEPEAALRVLARQGGIQMNKYSCLTNNPLLVSWELVFDTQYRELQIQEMFTWASREMEKGHQLCSHPLSGNIRPDITPYKSILISKEIGEFDFFGYDIITKARDYTFRLMKGGHFKQWDAACCHDFQLIDATLIKYALERNP